MVAENEIVCGAWLLQQVTGNCTSGNVAFPESTLEPIRNNLIQVLSLPLGYLAGRDSRFFAIWELACDVEFTFKETITPYPMGPYRVPNRGIRNILQVANLKGFRMNNPSAIIADVDVLVLLAVGVLGPKGLTLGSRG